MKPLDPVTAMSTRPSYYAASMPATLLALLTERLGAAARAAFGDGVALPDPLVLPTRDPRHGDYSCPAAMTAAKALGRNPFELAEALAATVELNDVCEPPEVVRPGFVCTRMTDGLKPAPFAVSAEEVAEATVRGLAGDAHTVWVPRALRYVFAVLRHLPRPIYRRLPL